MPTRIAPTRCCEKAAKAGSISLSVLALAITSCLPSERAAACRSAIVDWVAGKAGSARMPNAAALGINSRSNCNCFGASLNHAPRLAFLPAGAGARTPSIRPSGSVCINSLCNALGIGLPSSAARRGTQPRGSAATGDSTQSLFSGENFAGKKFGEARDWAGVFGDVSRFGSTETALSRTSCGKAADS